MNFMKVLEGSTKWYCTVEDCREFAVNNVRGNLCEEHARMSKAGNILKHKPGVTDYFKQLEREEMEKKNAPTVRTFSTGATRDVDDGKYDYEAFISPAVLKRYAEFMHSNRYQKDGTIRDGDNWAKGIPKSAYAKSLIRHTIEFWQGVRGMASTQLEIILCAIIFNASGYLYELLQERGAAGKRPQDLSKTLEIAKV